MSWFACALAFVAGVVIGAAIVVIGVAKDRIDNKSCEKDADKAFNDMCKEGDKKCGNRLERDDKVRSEPNRETIVIKG